MELPQPTWTLTASMYYLNIDVVFEYRCTYSCIIQFSPNST